MDQGGKRRNQSGHGCHVGHSPPTRFVYSFHALAYNLGNFLRTLATPEPIKEWSLTSLKEKLIKIGAKIVSHGRYVAFSDGRSRHSQKSLCRHSADDRGTAAAARCIDSVMRSVSRIPSKTGGKVRLDDGKFGKFSVRLDFGTSLHSSQTCPRRSGLANNTNRRTVVFNRHLSGECRLKITWHLNDLTKTTQAPTPAPGVLSRRSGNSACYYIGGDNHIHELYWDNKVGTTMIYNRCSCAARP